VPPKVYRIGRAVEVGRGAEGAPTGILDDGVYPVMLVKRVELRRTHSKMHCPPMECGTLYIICMSVCMHLLILVMTEDVRAKIVLCNVRVLCNGKREFHVSPQVSNKKKKGRKGKKKEGKKNRGTSSFWPSYSTEHPQSPSPGSPLDTPAQRPPWASLPPHRQQHCRRQLAPQVCSARSSSTLSRATSSQKMRPHR